MTPDSNRGDRLIKKQILSLNKHLPRQRKSLDVLLKEERPHVTGADGTRHRFKKAELDKNRVYNFPIRTSSTEVTDIY